MDYSFGLCSGAVGLDKLWGSYCVWNCRDYYLSLLSQHLVSVHFRTLRGQGEGGKGSEVFYRLLFATSACLRHGGFTK